MVLPNLPPINITIEDVQRYLEEEGLRTSEDPPAAEPVTGESVVGWRREWRDPEDHSKGQICEPLTYAEYQQIQAAMEEDSFTIIESRTVNDDEEA